MEMVKKRLARLRGARKILFLVARFSNAVSRSWVWKLTRSNVISTESGGLSPTSRIRAGVGAVSVGGKILPYHSSSRCLPVITPHHRSVGIVVSPMRRMPTRVRSRREGERISFRFHVRRECHRERECSLQEACVELLRIRNSCLESSLCRQGRSQIVSSPEEHGINALLQGGARLSEE
jgi:hypothetical protein